MVKKIINSLKAKLSSWLLKEPLKFALLSFGLIFGISIVYVLIRGLFAGGFGISPLVFLLLVAAALIFSACKLVKWLPIEKLDRRSFVAVDNGLTLIYFALFIGFTTLIANSTQNLLFYSIWLQSYSMFLFVVTALLGVLVYLYILGLLFTNIYATYKRALTMGIPKWKVILSLPFTFTMFWVAGYLLPEEKKTDQAIEIKSKWYARFTDWVVAKPINALIVFLFPALFRGLFFDSGYTLLVVLFVAIFGVWILFTGVNKFRKSIGGVFSTVTAVLNIAIVVALIGFLTFQVVNKPVIIQQETVQVTEPVVQKQVVQRPVVQKQVPHKTVK